MLTGIVIIIIAGIAVLVWLFWFLLFHEGDAEEGYPDVEDL